MTPLEFAATVSTVPPALEESALAPLVLAFANDPAVRWLYPDAHHYRIFFPRFARAFGGKAFALGTAQQIDGFRGSALWLPPGVEPDAEVLVPLIEETVAPVRRAGVFAVLEKMGALHPSEPHWHLPLLGVDPRHQGRRLGSELLSQTLATCDRDGVAAYLEASNPRNVPFYERHGFEVRGGIQAADSPEFFTMVRAPR